jgi:hypothetical protein
VNLISFGIFGIIFLTILAMISNSSEESQENIQNQMFLMNCPAPSFDGLWNATNVSISGFVVILNDSAGVSYGGEGTVFRCSIATLTPFPAFQVQMTNKNYTETTLGFPTGWFIYAGDFIGASFQRANNLFQLIGLFISPTGFNILGYGLNDLSGIALMFVIAIYAFCYIAIGLLMYKALSPFAGAG